ncbi:MAG: CDP-alcohol phosphatidyltransferase family protein [Halobacteriovoraceae bacterium]|nr:CDP-alcohol phosphatidyltransferase family protein [Halobacteriovoraceae bacterium]
MSLKKNKNYQYKKDDQSILDPIIRKYLTSHILKIIPLWVPANFITLFSASCIFTGLILLQLNVIPHHLLIIAEIVCILTYIIGDLIDGEQSRRTNTSSSLGEFLDHYCDIIVTACVPYIMFRLLGYENYTFEILIYSSFYSFIAAQFIEHYMGGVFVGEKLGSLEGLFLTIGLIILGNIPITKSILNKELIFSLSGLDIIFLSIALSTYFETIKRIFKYKFFKHLNISLYFALLLIATYLLLHVNSTLYSMLFLSMFGTLFVGKVLLAKVSKDKLPYPDFVSLLILCTAFVNNGYKFKTIAIAYLVAMTLKLTYLSINNFFDGADLGRKKFI